MVISNSIVHYLKYIKKYFYNEHGIMLTNRQCISHCINASIDTVKGSIESNYARLRIVSLPGKDNSTVSINKVDKAKLIKLQKQLGFIKVSMPFLLSVVIIEQGKLYMELCRLKSISLE